MSNYDPTRVAAAYVSQVQEILVKEHRLSQSQAETAIHHSGIRDCIFGCPYIANHYPAAKAANRLAEKSAFPGTFAPKHPAEVIHHATY